jgi:hypothetical protein
MVAPEDRGTLPRLAEATGRTKHLLLKDVRRNGLPCLERPARAARLPVQQGGGAALGFERLAVTRATGGGGEPLDLDAERARLAKAQADHQETRNAELGGRMMDVDEGAAELDRTFGAMRAKLLAMPHRLAPVVRPDDPAAAYADPSEGHRRGHGRAEARRRRGGFRRCLVTASLRSPWPGPIRLRRCAGGGSAMFPDLPQRK